MDDENQNPYHLPTPSFHPDKREQSSAGHHANPNVGDTSDAYTNEIKDTRHWWEKLGKKEWIIIAAAVVLLAGGVTAFILLNRNSAPTQKKLAPTATKDEKGQQIVSALTGLPVTQADRERPVTGVMIENTPWARPQSGLKEAGIVYEAIAEAGITRFLALYQEAKPANLGPIRSARLYYVNWLQGYDASLSHVGGSPEALRFIKATKGFKDLDQSFNGNFYHRISQRFAPHNVYTSMDRLNELEKEKGYFAKPNFTGFSRKADAPSKAPTARSIDLNIARDATYNVHYAYDKASNSYLRSEGGAPHMDAESNKQLSPKVVVALVVPYSIQSDGYHSDYQVIGTGQATVFQDGISIPATWSKGSNTDRLSLKDAKGNELKLNAGQTWITAINTANAVTFKP